MADKGESKRSSEESSVIERTSKRPCYDQGAIISVLVGPTEHNFAVHRDVLCKRSDFFRAACSTRWREGQEQVVRLPEVKLNVFQVYVDWAYTGVLAIEDETETASSPSCRPIIDVYLLGDILGDVKLRNQAMRLLNIHVTERRLPSHKSICRIWENTPENSRLRDWAVAVTMLGDKEFFVKSAGKLPPEFVSLVATRLLQVIPAPTREYFTALLSSQKFFEKDLSASEMKK